MTIFFIITKQDFITCTCEKQFFNKLYPSSGIGSTPIFTGDGEGGSGFAAAAAAAAAGGVSGFDFGVDPNLDPELALALRVSMEEERARQEAAAKKAADETATQEKGETSQDVTMAENVNVGTPEPENKATDLMVCILSVIFMSAASFE